MSVKFCIPIGTRVRLKGDRADVYPFAVAGSEGVIKARRSDDMRAFPMVFIEWDSEHWTYNGELHGWTFEDHFEPVEDSKMPEKKPDRDDALRNAAEALLAAIGEPKPGIIEPEEEEGIDEIMASGVSCEHFAEQPFEYSNDYEKIVEKALEFLTTECKAFILVGVEQIDKRFEGGDMVLTPRVYASYQDRDAGLLVEAQLATLVANLVQDQVMELIHRRGEDEDT